jgi:hypothetical protein
MGKGVGTHPFPMLVTIAGEEGRHSTSEPPAFLWRVQLWSPGTSVICYPCIL